MGTQGSGSRQSADRSHRQIREETCKETSGETRQQLHTKHFLLLVLSSSPARFTELWGDRDKVTENCLTPRATVSWT